MTKFCRIHSREVLNSSRTSAVAYADMSNYKAPTMRSNIRKGKKRW